MNRPLILTVKRPGSLLSKWLETPITEEQYHQLVMLLSKPDEYVVTRKPPMGFGRPDAR